MAVSVVNEVLTALRNKYEVFDNVFAMSVRRALFLLGVPLRNAAALPTRGLPAVDSPTPLISMLGLYIFCVVGGLGAIRVGAAPREGSMRKEAEAERGRCRRQEPSALRYLVLAHNAFCTCLSFYMAHGLLSSACNLRYSVCGNAYNEEEKSMTHYIYVFYMSKMVEFLDTIIMLLKRNVRQVTVLHVYHHVSVAIIWWIISYHAPGGDAYISAALNSIVHVFMYLYYFLSALWTDDMKRKQRYLFWGKYLTQMQMLQFTINMVQAMYSIIFKSPYPQFLCKILLGYMISLLILFYNFYTKKYKLPKQHHH
ncbi:hypothetical protein KP509_1Z209700 [Ceratopteris richardii]|nr:hypothetical protein KP509_1Z209700 [Ceratopteris richardii]